jgi:hypothetical protein
MPRDTRALKFKETVAALKEARDIARAAAHQERAPVLARGHERLHPAIEPAPAALAVYASVEEQYGEPLREVKEYLVDVDVTSVEGGHVARAEALREWDELWDLRQNAGRLRKWLGVVESLTAEECQDDFGGSLVATLRDRIMGCVNSAGALHERLEHLDQTVRLLEKQVKKNAPRLLPVPRAGLGDAEPPGEPRFAAGSLRRDG